MDSLSDCSDGIAHPSKVPLVASLPHTRDVPDTLKLVPIAIPGGRHFLGRPQILRCDGELGGWIMGKRKSIPIFPLDVGYHTIPIGFRRLSFRNLLACCGSAGC